MTMTIDAIYEAGVFRPLSQINSTDALREGKHVKLIVDAEDAVMSEASDTLDEAEAQKRMEIVQAISALSVSYDREETASRDHDTFLYGPEGAR